MRKAALVIALFTSAMGFLAGIEFLSLKPPIVLSAGDTLEFEPLPNPEIIGEGGVLDKITNVLFTALLTVAAIFIIVAGYQFATATGETEKLIKARQALIYAIAGVVLAFAARGLVKLIKDVINPEEENTILDFFFYYFS